MKGSKYSFTDCFVSMITKPFTQRLVIIPQWVKAHQREKKKKNQGRAQTLNLQKEI